jgi:hypothetical protein
MAMINPIVDPEQDRITEQLAQAAALRKQGFAANTGGGYQGGKVFMVGSPLGNVAQTLAGIYLGEKAHGEQTALENARLQERQSWLDQLPKGYTEKTETVLNGGQPLEAPAGQQVPPAGNLTTGVTSPGFLNQDFTQPGVPTGAPQPATFNGESPLAASIGAAPRQTTTTQTPMSPLQQAKAMQEWAMKAPRGMEGVQQFALQQALTAPQREAEAAQKAADRLHELKLKAMDARATQAERLEAQKEIARMNIEGRQDLARLAASLKASGGGSNKADPTDYADAIHDAALKHAAGDTSWRLGMPKELWGPVQNEAVNVRKTVGMTPEEIASSPNDFKERMALQRNYASGQASRRIGAFNTALAHMDTMETLGKGLAGTDIPAANAVMNYVAKQTGSPGPVAFETAKTFVAKEMARAFQEVGAGSAAERAHVEELFSSAKTPAQLNAALKTSRELMSGQLKTLEQPYKGTLKRNDFRERYLTPEAKKQMAAFPDKVESAPAADSNAEARAWLAANPNHPRAAAVRAKLEGK